jgi:hypothetical protein
MALLFWEGFDSITTWQEMFSMIPNFVTTWDLSQGGATIATNWSSTSGRYGGGSTYPGVADGWGRIYLSSIPSEVYTGRAIYLGITAAGPVCGIVCFWGNDKNNAGYSQDGPAPDIWLEHAGAGVLRVYNSTNGASWSSSRYGAGSGVLIGTTPAGTFRPYSWQWIEVRCKMSSSNTTNDGIVEVWLNGTKIISNTSCITKSNNAATGYFGVNTNSSYGGATDDIYVTDTTGAAPWNGRLGDVRITTAVPNWDVGANSGTPSTGTSHWAVVDETSYNTTDYLIIPNVVTNTERFYHTRLPTPAANIFAINPNIYALKSDAGVANIQPIIVANASGYYTNANTIVLTTSYLRYKDSITVNPETGLPWTDTEFTNTQIGVVVVA